MEDEDDLEMLRLAALKSLKKENVPASVVTALPSISMNKIHDGHVIPVVNNVRPITDKFYVAPGALEAVQPNLIHHPVPAYIDAGFEKMDIGDPYLPQRVNAPPLAPSLVSTLPLQPQQPLPPLVIPPAYPEFNPYANDHDPITNVQLSPRSAAFVYENKKIIKQRQGIPSPSSPKQNPFRQSRSPPRWSRSPTPDRIYHRKSRSPAYHQNHSPHYRNRTLSRSPQRRHSPQMIAHARRNRSRSRSPLLRANFDTNAHRSERRSPIPNRRAGNSSPPNNRHGPRQWRAHSPAQQHGLHGRKSGSPRNDEPNPRRRNRTRSPNASNANAHFRGQQDTRKRTASRSPNRKSSRTTNPSRGRRGNSPQQKRFNSSNGSRAGGGLRNRPYNRRSGSPTQNRRSSNSPQNHHNKRRSPAKSSPIENGDSFNPRAKEEREPTPMDQSERAKIEIDSDQKPIANEEESNESQVKQKSEQQIEDELLASSDSDNSDNDESDGIDLFASEESESENEGRFKLSSSKSERKTTVPTLSFSELGKTTTAPAEVLLRDLDEMQTDNMNAQSRRGGSGRRENDRSSIRSRHDTRGKFGRDRDRDRNRERERDRDRGRDSRDGDRERNRDRGSGSRRERESSKPKTDSANDKSERKTSALKLNSETRTRTPTSGKFFNRFVKNQYN